MLAKKFYSKIKKNLNSNNIFYTNNGNDKTFKDLNEIVLKFLKLSENFPKLYQNKIFLISDKSFENYSIITSILISNNIWIQINKNSPLERIISMFYSINPDTIIFDKINSKNSEKIKNFFKEKKIKIFTFHDILNLRQKKKNITIRHHDNDHAMTFFTSGSTGDPKAINITNKNFITSFYGQLRSLYKDNKKYIFGDYHDNSFVIILNILLPCLYKKNSISPALSLNDTLFFTEHMKKNKVNVLITVPSNINRIKNYKNNQKNLQVKKIVMCGETFYSDILIYLKKNYPKSEFYNCYGSTELSPWVFSYKYQKKNQTIIDEKGIVPIGKNFFNVDYFLNKRSELNIKGPMVVSGYTKKILNKNKFIKKNNQWVYNTGDIAEKSNNLIFIKGRSDSLEKINGYRIEMLEIETKLRSLNSIKNCYVYSQNIDTYEKIIVAAIEYDDLIKNKNYLNESIKNYLMQKIPSYMMPKKFILYKKFPVNKNGKIDKFKIKSNTT